MAGASEGAVNFLNLAYLLEFSLVLNLTYRELKFPELYDGLKEKVEDIHKKYTKKSSINDLDDEEVNLHPELEELHGLLNPESHKKKEGQDRSIWGTHRIAKWFFKRLIKNRCSLSVVNFNIIFSLVILIICTLLSTQGFYVWFDSVFCFKQDLWGKTWSINMQYYWCLLAFFSMYLCVLPLFFIRLGTICETLFYGKDGNNGVVGNISSVIQKRCSTLDALVKGQNNSAKNFTADDEEDN